MASISIASASVPNWQQTSDVQLRIYPLQSFEAADGSLEVQGSPSADVATAGNWFESVACTLTGTTLTIAACSLESTTDSPDNPAATYGAFFYTTEGQQIGPFGAFAKFVLPATPTSTTWAAIEAAQQGIL